jgi:glycerophosphoryl diester phosphodiesterase
VTVVAIAHRGEPVDHRENTLPAFAAAAALGADLVEIELGAEYRNPWFGLVTPEGVASVHRAGRRVSTWTVDTPEEMTQVLGAGVDAVVSNRIAALVAHLGR